MTGVRPLPPQEALTRSYLLLHLPVHARRPQGGPRHVRRRPGRRGIPSDGRFDEPVYRSDLFKVTPEEFPQLVMGRDEPVDYRRDSCPVSERAAYDEAVWLPQFTLLGDDNDIDDILNAVEKVLANLDALEHADPSLAALKSMSRAERPRIEKKNY